MTGISAADAVQQLGKVAWEALSLQARAHIIAYGLPPKPEILLDGYTQNEIRLSPQMVARLRSRNSPEREA